MCDDHEYDAEYFKMRLVNTDTASNVKNPRCIDLDETFNKINTSILMIICTLCERSLTLFCTQRKFTYTDKGF